MKIDLMNSTGQQIHVTINEFAEALSKGDVSGLCYSYYNHDHPLNGKPTANDKANYYHSVSKPSFTKLAKHLRSLPEVNSVFEFYISWTPDWESDVIVDLTFTRQGDTVLVEIH